MSLEGNAVAERVLKGKLVPIPRIDNTLTKEGQAAEAKATGAALDELSKDVNNAITTATSKVQTSLDTHKKDKSNPHGVTPAQIGAAPAVESADYPGCYYRTVNGKTEWENPPMVLGVEYRTTERWQGKAVYTKLVDCGTLPNNENKGYVHNIGCTAVIRYHGTTSNGLALPSRLKLSGVEYYIDIAANVYAVYMNTNADYSDQTAMVQLWYTKD